MPQKNLGTCGECGILLNKSLADKNRAEMLRIYGKAVRSDLNDTYHSFTHGWNYTLNPMQAAMARTQLKKYPMVLKQIQSAARKLTHRLDKFEWIISPVEPKGVTSAFHFYRVRLKAEYFGYRNSGRFRKAVQGALDAEGLNVRLYQNTPLPDHPVFRYKHSLGCGLPWSLNKKQIKYCLDDYPNSLDVIRSTLILGAIGSTPAYLLKQGTIEKYAAGFQKIQNNISQLLDYANTIKYKEPWEDVPAISDSYKTKYVLSRDTQNRG